MTKKQFNLLSETFPHLPYMSYIFELRRQLKGCKSVLDIGCGVGSPVRFVDSTHTVGLDGYSPALKEAEARGTHHEFALGDATELDKKFKDCQFDACVALDLIEHLTEKEGLKLIKEMERIAKKRVIIFTPNGYIPQESHDGDLQAHHSGWDADYMKKLGYTVYGMYGLKSLRGETHNLKIRPKVLGGLIAEMSHYSYTRTRPEKAAAIFCVKELGK